MKRAETVHGTCVAIDGRGIMFRGPSGSGKSDLALRVIETGGRLVADDRTILDRDGERLIARCPETIAGRIEIRGVGLCAVPVLDRAELVAVCDLVGPGEVARLPEPGSCRYLGVAVPLLRLAPFEASAVAKVRYGVLSVARRDPS